MKPADLQLVRSWPRVRRVRTRRGSVYVLVLGVSTMIAVVGLGAVMLSRTAIRTTAASRDWSESGIAAQSGLELAVGVMNASSTWRTDAKSGETLGPFGIGKAKVALSVVDETDGDLANDATQSVRVYALASVGSTTRTYSAVAAVASTNGLDVLRCPVHAGGNITVSQNAVISAGPLSCNSTISNSATLTADVETSSLSSTGFIAGQVQTGVADKTMPDNTAWTALSASAVTIPFASISGGTMDKAVLTPYLNNISGTVSATGVYAINVPLLSTLTIKRSRLQATLLVSLGASAKLVVQDENLWDPGGTSQPALIVQGAALSSVTLGGSTTNAALSESVVGVNYNPNGAPYSGVIDSDTLDSYPCELHGVFHIYSSIGVTVSSNLKLVGSLIAAGNVTISTAATLTANPALLTSPPLGYSSAANSKMRIVEGTYRWEVTNVNPATAVDAGSGGVTGVGP